MIKYLKISNHLSFKKQVVFDLESNGKPKYINGFFCKNKTGNKDRITKLALIYGSNASGKSNLLKTIKFLMLFVLDSYFQKEEENFLLEFAPFALNHKEESQFEICFLLENIEIVYKLIIQNQKVKFESLYENGKRKFERTQTYSKSDQNNLQEEIPLERLNDYSSYISKAIADNFPYYKELKEKINTVFFNQDFGLGDAIIPKGRAILHYFHNPDFKQRVTLLLSKFDTGIEDVEIQKIDIPNEKQKFTLEVYSKHVFGKLSFEQESTGTQKLFNILYPILISLDRGLTICIDEIGNCLHPLIITEIVKMFLDPEVNTKNAQLISTLHEADIMDIDAIVKQQIYFTEKSDNGDSAVFRLSDFKDTRNTISYAKKYMLGKYGALPFIR